MRPSLPGIPPGVVGATVNMAAERPLTNGCADGTGTCTITPVHVVNLTAADRVACYREWLADAQNRRQQHAGQVENEEA